MFFDRKNQTQDSHSSLMKIAKLQYELYIQGIREPSPELERERTALSLREKENHMIQSICWWNLSWPQVYDELKMIPYFQTERTKMDGNGNILWIVKKRVITV